MSSSIRPCRSRSRLRPAGPVHARSDWSISATTENGQPLEVMAVQRADRVLLVIHAMELREKYRPQYEDAKRWRR
jgi:hypothetical protein